jgi:hypothetical protein
MAHARPFWSGLRAVNLTGGALPIKFSLHTPSSSISGKEFFFLDNETRLCTVAPVGWREQPMKTSAETFILFLWIKFFASHCGMLQ